MGCDGDQGESTQIARKNRIETTKFVGTVDSNNKIATVSKLSLNYLVAS